MSSIVTDTGVHICKLLSIYLFRFLFYFDFFFFFFATKPATVYNTFLSEIKRCELSFYVLQSFCFAQQLEEVMILLSYYVINLNM